MFIQEKKENFRIQSNFGKLHDNINQIVNSQFLDKISVSQTSIEGISKSQTSTSNSVLSEIEDSEIFHNRFQIIQELHIDVMSAAEIYKIEEKSTKQIKVLKKIPKSRLNQSQLTQCQLEMSQTKFQHFNILSAQESYEFQNQFDFILDFLEDADYFQRIIMINSTNIENETELKCYTCDLLNGLIYLHEQQNLIHCDLKLENIFTFVVDDIRRIKIADFGLVLPINPKDRTAYSPQLRGTSMFRAPELKAKQYVKENVDLWALGMILYYMAVGYLPQSIKNYNPYQVDSGDVPFMEKHWNKFSAEFLNFVTQLLKKDPTQRIETARKAKEHVWLI